MRRAKFSLFAFKIVTHVLEMPAVQLDESCQLRSTVENVSYLNDFILSALFDI